MINVIGIGQNRENMTLGAVKAIEESDVIIGYKKYIDQTLASLEWQMYCIRLSANMMVLKLRFIPVFLH